MTVGRTVSDDELAAYLDGELSAARRAEIDLWLTQHPEEAARLDAWGEQDDAIRAAYDPVMAEPLPPALAALGQDRPRASLSRSTPWWAAAAAALVLFSAGYSTARITTLAPSAHEETIGEYGLEAHAVYAGEIRHPVEVAASEESHLVSWLSKRMGAPLVVPDLSKDGLSLVGGRLLPAGGKPCAMLMYETASGDRFSLLVASGGAASDTAFRYQEGDGFGSFYWYSGDFGYALVGPADKALLLSLSRQVYEAMS